MTMKRATDTDMVKHSRARKRMRIEEAVVWNWFDALGDDVVISILIKVAESANSPSDLMGIMSSCKRMKELSMNPLVLRNASQRAISIPPKSWCDGSHHFLSCCADSGNIEASYMLGMIEFYCLGHYDRGIDLLVQAAEASHAEALYSLAIIQIIGSGDNNEPHWYDNLDHPVSLCVKSAMLGHRDTLTEYEYCSWSCARMPHPPNWVNITFVEDLTEKEEELHPANQFLVEWWQQPHMKSKREYEGLKICSRLCGRRETKSNEFRKCGNYNDEFYCSYACRDVHWETAHHYTCRWHV